MASEQQQEVQQENKRLVVIGIDGSEHSDEAFKFYCDNLHQPDTELLLVHNAELPVVPTGYPMYSSGDLWEQLLDKEKEKVKKLEEGYAQKMKARGLSGKIKAIFANKPGETIVHEANEAKAAMIIVGCRGLGTLRRTIMGSVSDYIVHHAHCPVLVCRH